MKIACLTFNPIQENTYVVWDDTKECAVIDAGNSTPKEDAALDGFLAEHGLKPVLAVNTHGHFDHVLGVEHLRKTYGIPFALSGKDAFMLDTDAVGSTVYGVKINAMPPHPLSRTKASASCLPPALSFRSLMLPICLCQFLSYLFDN